MRALILISALLAGCASAQTPAETDDLATLYPADTRTAEDIVKAAYAAAGGESWRRPKSLYMDGYAVFYKDGTAIDNERHQMWRVYDVGKKTAHAVDGKVRIKSERGGKALINLAYDGKTTSTDKGPQPKSDADKQWSSAFGFGVIRHALDPGYKVTRLGDDLVDGHPVYMIRVNDPEGGETIFGIQHNTHRVLKVGFDTARGWHERTYSNFYSNPNAAWVQPGRVRLSYNGVKANEVIWTHFTTGQDLPDCLFVLPEAADCAFLPNVPYSVR